MPFNSFILESLFAKKDEYPTINDLVTEALNKQQKDGVFLLPRKNNTDRPFKTKIPPEKRTLKNLPKYKGSNKSIVRFQDWLQIKKPSEFSGDNVSYGHAANGSWVGWSHRAVGTFRIGQKVTPDTIGNTKKKTFIIATDEEARQMAKSYAKEIA